MSATSISIVRATGGESGRDLSGGHRRRVVPRGDEKRHPILKRKGVERRVALTVGTYLGIPLALQNSGDVFR
jgi:hypothetical protein